MDMHGSQALILMGSDSDLKVMNKAAEILGAFKIAHTMTVASAHRTPDRVMRLAKAAETAEVKVIIAGAGMAAHLAGFLAAHTILPVIGVPLEASPLGGLDALLSTVQMPGGVPVACMGIGSAGAKNAALFAVEILALNDEGLRTQLREYRARQAKKIEEKAARIEARYADDEDFSGMDDTLA